MTFKERDVGTEINRDGGPGVRFFFLHCRAST